MNGKSPLRAVVIQTTADAALSIPSPLGGGGAAAASALPLAGAVAVVLCQAFGMLGVDPTCFCSPDTEAVFASGEGHAGVEAYVKARPGFLFPMERGLAFLESVRRSPGVGRRLLDSWAWLGLGGGLAGRSAPREACPLTGRHHSLPASRVPFWHAPKRLPCPLPPPAPHAQPPTFLPRAAIQSVELARAGGGSSTFDLYVHCRDGSTTEFSSIPRNEIGPLEGGCLN